MVETASVQERPTVLNRLEHCTDAHGFPFNIRVQVYLEQIEDILAKYGDVRSSDFSPTSGSETRSNSSIERIINFQQYRLFVASESSNNTASSSIGEPIVAP